MPTKQAKPVKSFRLDRRHIKVLEYMTRELGTRDGTNYSQAQILERAITCLWQREFNEHASQIYQAFAKDEPTG